MRLNKWSNVLILSNYRRPVPGMNQTIYIKWNKLLYNEFLVCGKKKACLWSNWLSEKSVCIITILFLIKESEMALHLYCQKRMNMVRKWILFGPSVTGYHKYKHTHALHAFVTVFCIDSPNTNYEWSREGEIVCY